MPDSRISMAMSCILLSVLAGQAQAWGAVGHDMISSMAMELLPDDMPAFLLTEDVPFTIGELSREPDRWRDAGTTHDMERNSGHWINLDDQGRAVGGPTLAELPDTREAYDTLARAVGRTQYSAGYLPYSIVDGWQQLVKDFAYWRVDVAATETATDPARAARFARDRQLREMLILRDLGVWSHYVADASNPMHTTIHSDGWGDYPNPSGYSTERGLHTRFESAFVNANIEAAEVLERVPAPASCDCSIMDRVRTYIGSSNAQVIPLYELERQGAFDGPNEAGRGFRRDANGGGSRRNPRPRGDGLACQRKRRGGLSFGHRLRRDRRGRSDSRALRGGTRCHHHERRRAIKKPRRTSFGGFSRRSCGLTGFGRGGCRNPATRL